LACDAVISRAAVAGKVWGTQLHRALQEAAALLSDGQHVSLLNQLLPHVQRLLAHDEPADAVRTVAAHVKRRTPRLVPPRPLPRLSEVSPVGCSPPAAPCPPP
jgi:hypothetical protein